MLHDWKGPYNRRLARKLSERGRRMARARWEAWKGQAHLRPEPEPKMKKGFPLEFGVRDKRTGEEHWHDLVSVRHAAKALGLVQKFCS